jgi:hypothetical protein
VNETPQHTCSTAARIDYQCLINVSAAVKLAVLHLGVPDISLINLWIRLTSLPPLYLRFACNMNVLETDKQTTG